MAIHFAEDATCLLRALMPNEDNTQFIVSNVVGKEASV